MPYPTTAPVRLLAGEWAELQASEHAERVEGMLAERLGREPNTEERFAALASQLMTLLADRSVEEVRAVLDRANARLLFGTPSWKIIRGLLAEVRYD